eukprot:TRINITY_DN9968_c0_g1_i3.p1 TRINITY_DN9968_c0_g1~~TRINITY_DN9968_c0_g1_i3.p1  ORF type:complete len:249 (+),score=70.78 TRINITY_DN9968_c0_g1_i3:1027-1773(+)
MEKYRDVEEGVKSLPTPLNEIILLISEIVRLFEKQYNYGKQSTKELMGYCQVSIERFVFSKVYETVFGLYMHSNMEADAELNKKTQQLKKFRGRKLMQLLEFKPEYIAVTEEEEEKGKVGYDSSIEAINKIELLLYPHEKLAQVMQMYADMKTTVIDYSKGKTELITMDDQMPVFIYIMAMCTLPHPFTEINFLNDYLNYQDRGYDTEQQLVTNLQVIFTLHFIGKSAVHPECFQASPGITQPEFTLH